MRRGTAVKKFVELLKSNDIILFSNRLLFLEAKLFNDQVFYFDTPEKVFEAALGVAMTNNKRVFIICEDVDVLRAYYMMPQIGVSKQLNVFIIMLNCGRYQNTGGQPSIFDEIHAPKGAFFSLNFTIFEFTKYIKPGGNKEDLKDLIANMRGPVFIFIKINEGISKHNESDVRPSLADFSKFVSDFELGTSLFAP